MKIKLPVRASGSFVVTADPNTFFDCGSDYAEEIARALNRAPLTKAERALEAAARKAKMVLDNPPRESHAGLARRNVEAWRLLFKALVHVDRLRTKAKKGGRK